MKVLVVSDTHGNHKGLEAALKAIGPIDMFLHLGDVEKGEDYLEALVDCETHFIRGNNDFFADLPGEKEIRIDGHKVFITHGHYYYVSLETDYLGDEAVSRGAEIVMFGHTHRPIWIDRGDVVLLNPGSIAYPRQAGRKRSFMVIHTSADGVFQFEQYFLESNGTAICTQIYRKSFL